MTDTRPLAERLVARADALASATHDPDLQIDAELMREAAHRLDELGDQIPTIGPPAITPHPLGDMPVLVRAGELDEGDRAYLPERLDDELGSPRGPWRWLTITKTRDGSTPELVELIPAEHAGIELDRATLVSCTKGAER